MKPFMTKGDISLFRNEWGRVYGLREIGNRKSWHRWQTPDGVKHRFAKDACAHLDGQALKRKAAELRREAEKRGRQEMELARLQEQRKVALFQAVHSLAVAWRTHHVTFHGIEVRPPRRQAAA